MADDLFKWVQDHWYIFLGAGAAGIYETWRRGRRSAEKRAEELRVQVESKARWKELREELYMILFVAAICLAGLWFLREIESHVFMALTLALLWLIFRQLDVAVKLLTRITAHKEKSHDAWAAPPGTFT